MFLNTVSKIKHKKKNDGLEMLANPLNEAASVRDGPLPAAEPSVRLQCHAPAMGMSSC